MSMVVGSEDGLRVDELLFLDDMTNLKSVLHAGRSYVITFFVFLLVLLERKSNSEAPSIFKR